MGRHLKYKTKEALEDAISDYFEQCGERPTITGLAYHLGFNTRSSIYNYKKREEFMHTIKKAMLFIESKHEEHLYDPGSTGSIFWLKSRGWDDGGSKLDNIEEKLNKIIPNYFE